ncbi:hypothetical protein AAC387_Pa05g2128 [Persea americana]
MEMGSSSTSGASASTDSLNGLKFGKKIYFEDVGVGAPAKAGTLSGFSSSSSSSSSTSSSPAKASEAAKMVPRKGRGVVQGGQPPRCQVEGCKVDLTGAKPYYCKHKVCGMHSKSPKVIVNGLEQRFCQQCSRFHQLPEFDQGKRSCRRRLAGHNERRRKPPLMSFTSRNGRLSSSFPEDISRVGGFPMDFTYIRSAGREVWPSARVGEPVSGNQSPALGRFPLPLWKGHIEVPPANVSTHGPEQYLQGSAGVNAFANLDIPSSGCFAGISNSSCALSLLSSQPWGPRNRASGSIAANDFMNHEGSTVAPPSHSAMANSFMSSAWSFKGQEASSSSHGVIRELGLGETVGTEFSGAGELYSTRQGSKQCMDDREQLRQYGASSNQIHWSL